MGIPPKYLPARPCRIQGRQASIPGYLEKNEGVLFDRVGAPDPAFGRAGSGPRRAPTIWHESTFKVTLGQHFLWFRATHTIVCFVCGTGPCLKVGFDAPNLNFVR